MLKKNLPALAIYLVLMIIAMYNVRAFLIEPTLMAFSMMPGLTKIGLAVLVSSILFMIIAAYSLIEKKNQRSFFILIGISMLGFIFVAKASQVIILAIFPVFVIGLLWFYQLNYRFQPWLNMMVKSGLIALSFLFLLIFDAAFYRTYFAEQHNLALFLLKIISAYALLIALYFMIEKVLSDMYSNFKGKQTIGSFTETYSLGYAKILATILIILLTMAVAYLQFLQLSNDAMMPFLYLLLLIQFPFFIILILLYLPSSKEIYQILSVLMHVVLIGATAAIPVLYYSA